jgi:hypothetical protein
MKLHLTPQFAFPPESGLHPRLNCGGFRAFCRLIASYIPPFAPFIRFSNPPSGTPFMFGLAKPIFQEERGHSGEGTADE